MGVRIRQKEKGGPWWVFISRKGKRRSKLVGTDKKEANALAKELRGALAAGDLGLMREEEPAGVSFEDYADKFLKVAETELKHSTFLDYKGCVKRQLKPFFKGRELASIKRRDVKAFVAHLQQAGLKPNNVRKHLRILSSILSEAVDNELIAANEALHMKSRRRSKDRAERQGKPIVPLTREELTALLTTAQTHAIERKEKTEHPFRDHYPFLLTLARTGLRLGEAIALKWGDVDQRGSFIEVQRAQVDGKLSATKSGKSRRVYMSEQLRTTLRKLYEARFERVVALDPEAQAALEAERANVSDAWIFPNSEGNVMDPDNFRRRIFKPLLLAAKLRGNIRIHDLRHTFASLLLEARKEIHFVQEQLGHHSAAFTLAKYGHLIPRDRRDEVNCLDDAAPVCTPAAPATETTVLENQPDVPKAVANRG